MAVTESDLLLLAQETAQAHIKRRQGPGGRMLDYVDARYVMQFLDDTVGPANWQDDYAMGDGGKVSCRIGIRVGDEWVWKGDGAGESDIEGEKGSFSDAFKRAAVKWGIARDLYGAPTSGTGRASAPSPARPAAAPRPVAVAAEIEEPEWMQPAADAAPTDVGSCPVHHTPWRTTKANGEPAKRAFCSQKDGDAWCSEKGPWLSSR